MLTAQPADPGDPSSSLHLRVEERRGCRGGAEGRLRRHILNASRTRWMAEAAERRQRVFTSRGISKSLFFQPCQHVQWICFVAIVWLLPPEARKTFKMGGWGGRDCLCVALIFWVVCCWIGSRTQIWCLSSSYFYLLEINADSNFYRLNQISRNLPNSSHTGNNIIIGGHDIPRTRYFGTTFFQVVERWPIRSQLKVRGHMFRLVLLFCNVKKWVTLDF